MTDARSSNGKWQKTTLVEDCPVCPAKEFRRRHREPLKAFKGAVGGT